MKHLILAVLALCLAPVAHADCENFFRGFHVDSYYYGGNPSESVYFEISSDDLGLRATVAAYYDRCSSDLCKKNLEVLRDAPYDSELIKFGVTPAICSNLDKYTMMTNAGGSIDVIPVQAILSADVDLNYPF